MKQPKPNLFLDRCCEISECGLYRYSLDIIWDRAKPIGVYIGLNPSKADAVDDDPTCTRMAGFAGAFGWGGFRIINLAAFRATEPEDMFAAKDPIGPENDIRQLLIGFDGPKVACWGNKGRRLQAGAAVANVVALIPNLLCFGYNADGSPKHPLYLKASTELVPFKGVWP